eukprot:scaffold141789_cov32-Tisochrysis_lutea.AAC.7
MASWHSIICQTARSVSDQLVQDRAHHRLVFAGKALVGSAPFAPALPRCRTAKAEVAPALRCSPFALAPLDGTVCLDPAGLLWPTDSTENKNLCSGDGPPCAAFTSLERSCGWTIVCASGPTAVRKPFGVATTVLPSPAFGADTFAALPCLAAWPVITTRSCAVLLSTAFAGCAGFSDRGCPTEIRWAEETFAETLAAEPAALGAPRPDPPRKSFGRAPSGGCTLSLVLAFAACPSGWPVVWPVAWPTVWPACPLCMAWCADESEIR